MALARAEKTSERFYSASAQIEVERKQYYLELEHSQRGDTDIISWLDWFLSCLGRALQRAGNDLATTLRKARVWDRLDRGSVNARQRKVINLLLDGFEESFPRQNMPGSSNALRILRFETSRTWCNEGFSFRMREGAAVLVFALEIFDSIFIRRIVPHDST